MARILVIDDEPHVRDMVAGFLTDEGYEAATAEDGRAGAALFRQSPFDLVITDILMPEQEGLETIMQLRRLCPGVKIVAASGGSPRMELDVLMIAKRLGAVRTVRKPIDLAELLALVREVLAEPAGRAA